MSIAIYIIFICESEAMHINHHISINNIVLYCMCHALYISQASGLITR